MIARNATNPDNGMYTDGNNSFNIAEASQASVTVSCKAGKYGTVIFPFTPDVSTGFDDITFYSCETAGNGYVHLDEVTTPAANTPYIIKNESTDNFSTSLTGWGTASTESYNVGLLTGVYTNANIPASAGNYVLQTQNGTQAFYSVDAAFEATPYKCYLTVTGSNPVKAFYFDMETAINSIEANDAQNATIYNLAGQRVNKAQKGVNIINGKKMLVK